MTPAHGITLFIWSLTIAAEFYLTWILNFRPGRKTYPAFTVYINFCLCRSLILYALNLAGAQGAYFYTYYTGVILDCGLRACIVIEVARELFYPITILPADSYRNICVTVTGVTFACVASALLFPSNYPHLLFAAAREMDRTVSFLVCALFWAVAFHAMKLGIPWRKRLLGIALGLGLDATMNSVALAITSSTGRAFSMQVGLLIVCSGCGAMLTWNYFFLISEPVLVSPPIRFAPVSCGRSEERRAIS